MKSYVLKEILFPIKDPILGEGATAVIQAAEKRTLAIIDLVVVPHATRTEALVNRSMRMTELDGKTFLVLDWPRTFVLDDITGFNFILNTEKRGEIQGIWSGEFPFVEA